MRVLTQYAFVLVGVGALCGSPGVFAQSTAAAGVDTSIVQRVRDKLSADQVDYYKHVTVSATAAGVVTLAGTVDTTEALNKAKKIAGSVSGVTQVRDQMKVEVPPTQSAGR